MPSLPALVDSSTALQAADTPDMTSEYIPSPNQPLHIRVDSRERSSAVPALLAAFPDVTLSFAALPSADYLLSDDVAVERKTASDFVASIIDRRLFGQTTRMKVLFPRAMLIIEGDASETAALLRIMARHAQQRLGQPVGLREPRPQIEELYASYLVEGLPGVGPRRARMLLAHFGSPAAIMCAAADELSKVPGIGKK